MGVFRRPKNSNGERGDNARFLLDAQRPSLSEVCFFEHRRLQNQSGSLAGRPETVLLKVSAFESDYQLQTESWRRILREKNRLQDMGIERKSRARSLMEGRSNDGS
jgi:hypothetical protein